MKAKKLIELLRDVPDDSDVSISIDISTGDEDFDSRAFADDILGTQGENDHSVTILATGYLNTIDVGNEIDRWNNRKMVEEIQKEDHIGEANEKVFQMPKLKASCGTIYDVFKIMTDGDGIIHVWTTNKTGKRHWINFDGFELVG